MSFKISHIIYPAVSIFFIPDSFCLKVIKCRNNLCFMIKIIKKEKDEKKEIKIY